MAKVAAVLVGGAVMMAATTGGVAQVGELVDPNRLRVCADPSNLPFSNQAGEGFENEIAELLGKNLGREVAYTWFPQSVGFVRSTLGAGRCDLVIGIATTNELMQNSNPYYRSGYVLVQRAAADRKATSLHDSVLEDLRLGAVARTPPVTLLAQHGLLDQLKPYQLVVDTRYESPGRQMVEDVASSTIDVGVLWGPIAGYWAKRQSVPLEITPLVGEDKGVRLDFRISMGMRPNEPNWKRQINALLAASKDEIQAILVDYGVPLLDEQGQPIADAPTDAEKQGALEPVAEPEGYRMAEYRAPVPGSLAGATVVSTADLQALLETDRPILLDVLPLPREPANLPTGSVWRPPSHEHLPGSAWLPNVGYGELSAEFERYFRDNLARLTGEDRSRPLVFYCKADCWMSWNAAKRALAYGYDMVIWYPEGTEGWRAAGLPIEAAEPVRMPDFLPIPASAAVRGRAE